MTAPRLTAAQRRARATTRAIWLDAIRAARAMVRDARIDRDRGDWPAYSRKLRSARLTRATAHDALARANAT